MWSENHGDCATLLGMTISSERAAYSPVRRVVALLNVLTSQNADRSPSPVLTDAQLMDRTEAYGTGEGRSRTLRLDKAALRARGLIVTNLVISHEQFERGTMRAPLLDKDPQLHLTADEHRALEQAREQVRGVVMEVGPVEPAAPHARRANNRVDEALRLLRLLEEHQDKVEVEVVAAILGVGRQQAQKWLTELAEGLNTDGPDVITLIHSSERDDLSYRDLTAARLERPSRDTQRPLEGTGTWLLGLFPYSKAEAEERLRLISGYRGRAGKAAEDSALDSVVWKLEKWLKHLAPQSS